MRQRRADRGFYEPWADPTRDYSPGALAQSHTGLAGAIERRVLQTGRLIDRLQSRHPAISFAYAVSKKYADDEGSRLAALLGYYTFLSVFPLLIGGFAIVNTILAGRPDLVERLVADVVPGDLQQQVIQAYQALPDSGPAFAMAVVGLLLAGTGGVFSFYAMVNQVFCVPYRHRYGFGPRYARVLLMVVLLGVGVLVVVVGSAAAASFGDLRLVQRAGALVLLWAVAFGLLHLAVIVLCRRPLTFAEVAPGAALGALAMTVSLSLGSLLVGRIIASSSAVYGAFGTVVGTISVLLVVSNAIVLSFEASVVRAWQLWPRGVDINLLFPADERAYALLALMDERMPTQRHGVAFDAEGHGDPRRPDPASLQRRTPGVPLRPYDVPRAPDDHEGPEGPEERG